MSFPGKFTEHFLARAHVASEPELSRGHHGQAPRRLRAQHRLYPGPARRTSQADGDSRTGLRRLSPAGSRRQASTHRSCVPSPTSSPLRSSVAQTWTATRSPLSTRAPWPMPPSSRSARWVRAGWRSSRRTIPAAMVQYAEECRTLGIPYIWDPGQQCARMSGDELRDGRSVPHW